jgi:hypothetical protein
MSLLEMREKNGKKGGKKQSADVVVWQQCGKKTKRQFAGKFNDDSLRPE